MMDNLDILQPPNVPARPGIISDIANSRSKLPTTLQPQSSSSTPEIFKTTIFQNYNLH